MNHSRAVSPSSRLAWAACVLALTLPGSAQQGSSPVPRDEYGRPLPERPPGPDLTPQRIVRPEDEPEHFIVVALRASRTHRHVPEPMIASAIAARGDAIVEPICSMLAVRRVPAVEAGQLEQLLSRPQRDLLLGALAELEAVRALDVARLNVEGAETPGPRIALIELLGALGEPGDLPELYTVTFGPREEKLERDTEAAFREALSDVVRRNAVCFELLSGLIRQGRQELVPAALFALGDVGDLRGLDVIEEVVNSFPDQAALCASQIGRIGRSLSPATNRQLAGRLRWMLDPGRVVECRAAVLALGELRDHESIPAMIGFLESDDAGLRGNALWALRRVTDLAFGDNVELWRRWYAAELSWFQQDYAGARARLALSDPAHVAQALREIGERRIRCDELALDVLAVLERDDAGLRTLACTTLERLGEPLVVPALLDRLEDRDTACVQAAGRALVGLTGLSLPFEAADWREALGIYDS